MSFWQFINKKKHFFEKVSVPIFVLASREGICSDSMPTSSCCISSQSLKISNKEKSKWENQFLEPDVPKKLFMFSRWSKCHWMCSLVKLIYCFSAALLASFTTAQLIPFACRSASWAFYQVFMLFVLAALSHNKRNWFPSTIFSLIKSNVRYERAGAKAVTGRTAVRLDRSNWLWFMISALTPPCFRHHSRIILSFLRGISSFIIYQFLTHHRWRETPQRKTDDGRNDSRRRSQLDHDLVDKCCSRFDTSTNWFINIEAIDIITRCSFVGKHQ